MRWDSDRRRRADWACAPLFLIVLWTAGARADAAPIDTSYGRVDGDVGVVIGAGAVVAPHGVRGEAELRLRYLETAGLFATYEDSAVVGSMSLPRRVLSTGFELRPLFLFRWLKGHEAHHARLDMAIDSLGLGLAATFAQPAGHGFGSQRGLEVSLGIECPILDQAEGPWIGMRGGARWSEAALVSGLSDQPNEMQLVLTLTLAWHQLLAVHVVDI